MEPKEKRAFEPTGLVPRSIVRTFERFKQQLLPGSEQAAIREYRISRYQVLVSARCLFVLITIPIATNWFVSSWLLSPLIEHFWNTQQNEIFLNSYQEERAFAELEFFSDKLFFESLLSNDSLNDSSTSNTKNSPEHFLAVLATPQETPLSTSVLMDKTKCSVTGELIKKNLSNFSPPSATFVNTSLLVDENGNLVFNPLGVTQTRSVALINEVHKRHGKVVDFNNYIRKYPMLWVHGLPKEVKHSVGIHEYGYEYGFCPLRGLGKQVALQEWGGGFANNGGILVKGFTSNGVFTNMAPEVGKTLHRFARNTSTEGIQKNPKIFLLFSLKESSELSVDVLFTNMIFVRNNMAFKQFIETSNIDNLNEVVTTEDSLKIKERIQEKILELAVYYNQQTILSITNIAGDFISVFTLGCLFIWMRPEISILKSFLIEAIYSLSDTTKSFLLILLTDLLVGFHSPRGWETALELLLKHFGLPESQDFVFLFVATFPVLLDTVFKYWIFRHLNKISPSTVATYHSMIE